MDCFGYWVLHFGSAFGVANRVGAIPMQAKRIKLDLVAHHHMVPHSKLAVVATKHSKFFFKFDDTKVYPDAFAGALCMYPVFLCVIYICIYTASFIKKQ